MKHESGWINSGWCETYKGHRFYFDDSRIPSNTYDVEDIAHALGMSCRYGGHTQFFYSIAEHVCLIAQHVYDHAKRPGPKSGPQIPYWTDQYERACAALQLLHHDDPEYVLGDIVSPFKKELSDYKRKESLVERQIAVTFGLEYPNPPFVKYFDHQILVDERAQAMRPTANIWETTQGNRGLNVKLHGLNPSDAKAWYLDMHGFLMKKIAD